MQVFLKDFLSKKRKTNQITNSYHHFNPKKGTLVALISIDTGNNHTLDASNIARFLWNGVIEEFNYSDEDVLNTLKQCIKVAESKLLQLIKNDEKAEESGVDIRISLAAFFDGNLYFSILGEQDFYVIHQRDLINISEILKSNKVNSGSTNINHDDLIILGSGGYVVNNLQSVIDKPDDTKGLIKTLESINIEMSASDGIALASCFNHFEEDVIEEVAPELIPTMDEPDDVIRKPEPVKNGSGWEINEAGKHEKKEESIDKIEEPDKLAKTKETLSKSILASKVVIGNASEKVSPFIDKSKEVFTKVYTKGVDSSTSVLDKKYGRNPKFKRFKAKLSQTKVRPGRVSKEMKLGGYKDDSLKKRRFAIAAVGVVLIAVVFLGVQSAQDYKLSKAIGEEFTKMENEILTLIDDAERTLRSDPSNAELKIFSARKILSDFDISKDQLSEEDQKAYSEIESQILGVTDSINKVQSLSEEEGNFELFIDGRVQFSSNSNLTDITSFQNTYAEEHLYLSDGGTGSVYRVSASDRSSSTLAGSDKLGSSQLITVGSLGLYVYDSKNGIAAAYYGQNDADILSFEFLSGLTESSFGSANLVDIGAFTPSDHLYLLNTNSGSVLKSVNTGNGYGLPGNYIVDSRLTTGSDISADFDIYTTGESGLTRFTFNQDQQKMVDSTLEIDGLREPLGNISAATTGVDLYSNLFMFDKSNKRIIRIEKPIPSEGVHPGTMLYLKSYEYRGNTDNVFNDVKDIVVDQLQNNMYVLDGNKVWKIKL
jgi:hypothetical protein